MKHPVVAGVLLVIGANLIVFAQTRPPLVGISATDMLFADSVVQDIRLNLSAADWQLLKANFRENTYYPADFRWRDQVVRNIGIRSRGFGTRSPTKPGIRVDFNRFVGRQKFLDLRSLDLKNNVTDPSNMRERISMLLFRRMGFAAAPEPTAK